MIQDKQAKLIVRRRIKAGNFDECFDRVGVATLHLDKYAKKNTPVSYKLPIEKCSVQGGEIECIITVRFEGDPPVEYHDDEEEEDDDEQGDANTSFSPGQNKAAQRKMTHESDDNLDFSVVCLRS